MSLFHEELKDCPFCGAKARYNICLMLIQCTRCPAMLGQIKDKEELFNLWNTRFIPRKDTDGFA